MYKDAANRKIKEPVDYLYEAEKKSRKISVPLVLAGHPELAEESDRLHNKILNLLTETPVEEWENAN